MIVAVLAALVSLGLLDSAFSGFRASLGRSGLIDHAAEDRRGLQRGAALFMVLAIPALASLVVDTAWGGGSLASYDNAGLAFLFVIGPYAAIVGVALAGYAALRWQLKYVASALILGPFTLLRPWVVLAAAALAAMRAQDVGVTVTGGLAVAAVLLVEPMLNRFYRG